jgi:asparagine synthase (glutamine-hydrolysing)
MAQQTNRVKTFSIGFDVARYDETQYAREVARLFATEHVELRVDPKAIEILPRLVWHFGEPFADSSAIPSFYVSELTRRHVTVALNGDGGDENFGGYTRYLPLRGDVLLGLPRPVRAVLATVGRVLGPGPREGSTRARLARATTAAALAPHARYATAMAYFDGRSRTRLYTNEMLALAGSLDKPEGLFERAFAGSDAQDPVNRLLDVDVRTYLPGDLLVKMDIASMAHSLEVRSPLLDHKFMEMSASLPGEWKVGDGTTKRIFKDALRPWLPPSILDRPKAGFSVPLAHWFRSELRDLPREILLDRQAVERGLFRPQEVQRLIDAHVSGRWDNSHRLWALIQLELWFSTFIDGNRREPQTLGLTYSTA